MRKGIKDDGAAGCRVKTQHIAHFLKSSNTCSHHFKALHSIAKREDMEGDIKESKILILVNKGGGEKLC